MSAYEGWAIVELMGHRRLGGRVGEAEAYGAKLLRLDVPKTGTSDEWIATQFYGGSAIYCVTPCDEETARRVAASNQPAPVHHWQLPAAPSADGGGGDDDDDEVPAF